MCMERCCFRAVGASVRTTALLSSSLVALLGPYSASHLSRSASHSWSAAENSASFAGNLGLSNERRQTKLLEWLSGAISRHNSLQNSKPFWSRMPRAILLATADSWVHEFSIANNCLPRDLASSVISTGSTKLVSLRALSKSAGKFSSSKAKYVSTWKLNRSHWSRSFKRIEAVSQT